LQHLRIAGEPINGSANLHYTTFNNSVAPQADIANLRVDENEVDQLCAELFTAHTASVWQLHATMVVGGHRYHKYWDGTYGSSPGAPAISAGDRVTLNNEHTRMVNEITGLVTEAKARHGRVSANQNGAQINNNVGP
jgi:hypothetical protein